MPHLRICRTVDDPDQVDVDLEVNLSDFPRFDLDDERDLRALEAAIEAWLEEYAG